MLTQRRWRIFGGACLAISGAMALTGVRLDAIRHSQLAFATYWSVFLLFFAIAIYCALLDLRYIRAQHALAERELFRETLGEESFRKALRARMEEGEKKRVPPKAE